MSTEYKPETAGIEFKNEVAFKKVLLAGGWDEAKDGPIYTGENSDDRQSDCVICKCVGGPEEPAASGNYLLSTSVAVVTSTDKTETGSDPMVLHRRRVKKARTILWQLNDDGVETLSGRLSDAVRVFTAFPEMENEGVRVELADNKIWSFIDFKACCAEMDIPAILAPVRANLPCISPSSTNHCHCDQSNVVTSKVRGYPGRSPVFNCHVVQVMEQKDYTGGTNNGAYLQTGGQPNSNNFNFCKLEISSPPQTYFLNRTFGNPNEMQREYDFTFRADIGAIVTLTMDSVDRDQISNYLSRNPNGIDTAPYDGQFTRLTFTEVPATD